MNTTRSFGFLAASSTLLSLGLLGGCASAWEDHYVGHRDVGAVLASDAVSVRSVPWSRLQQTLHDLERDVAQSDTAAEDWSAEKKAEAKARLLRGLQLTQDPGAVEILGRSDFRTTNAIRPETDEGKREIERFARKVGANSVVWSSRSLGPTSVVTDQPVQNFRTGTYYFRDQDGKLHSDTYTDWSTSWIPVVVSREEVGFTAFFLRASGSAAAAK